MYNNIYYCIISSNNCRYLLVKSYKWATLSIVVPTYPQEIRSKTPNGGLKLYIVLNPIYTLLFPIHRHL